MNWLRLNFSDCVAENITASQHHVDENMTDFYGYHMAENIPGSTVNGYHVAENITGSQQRSRG